MKKMGREPSRPVKVSAPVVSPATVKVRDSWFQPPPTLVLQAVADSGVPPNDTL